MGPIWSVPLSPSATPPLPTEASARRQGRSAFLLPYSPDPRYFALKLPLAVDPEIVTFAYVNPGHQTDTELRSWGAAHGPLWDALRKKGRQVRVIGIAVENATLDRTARVIETWAAADPGTSDEGLTVKQEIKAIDDAMTQKDREFLARYGGFGGAMKRSAYLQKLPGSQAHRRGLD